MGWDVLMDQFMAWVRWASLVFLLAFLILRPADRTNGSDPTLADEIAALDATFQIFLLNDFDSIAGRVIRLEDRLDKLQQDLNAVRQPVEQRLK